MQISKTLLTCAAAALCLTAISARAADTEADLKLREALRQRMSELGPATPAPEPSKPVTKKAPKKAVAEPTTPAPVAEPAQVVVSPVVTATPAPVVTVPATSSDAQAEQMREALRIRLAQERATPTAAPQETVTQGSDLQPAVSTTQIVAPTTTTEAAAPPVSAPVVLQAPALPISGSKEQRLAALLQQYKTDQITPQQYHEQRARILAE